MTTPITVFVNGCFDILHSGHISFLQWARSQGDRLVIGLNSDASVKKLKGQERPIMPQLERRFILQSLRCVDDVIIFDEKTPNRLIAELKPDIICNGPDHVNSYTGIKTLIYSGVKGISTSSVIERVRKCQNASHQRERRQLSSMAT
jgi:D-beta-D-heptose 7-phosphate kinase/D-beta-D-heptose 1-phosphate adenosyltransferase